MDLRLLRDFITVADELHFGRAAKVQGIAQPVLSRHIQQIETDLGVELFQRTRRSVRLTHAGSIFLSSARQILLQSELALQAARHAAEGSLGSLRISCGPVTTYAILPTVLRLLKQRMPAIDVRVFHATTAEQLSSLLSNEVDVAFLIPPMDHTNVLTMPLFEERIVVSVPRTHRLSSRKRIQLSDLKNEPFIFPPRTRHDTGLSGALYHVCTRAGLRPRVAHEAYPIPTMLALVAAGFGVSLVPESVETFLRSDVVYLGLQESPFVVFEMAWRKTENSPVVKSFIESIVRDIRPQFRQRATNNGRHSRSAIAGS